MIQNVWDSVRAVSWLILLQASVRNKKTGGKNPNEQTKLNLPQKTRKRTKLKVSEGKK